MEEAATTYGKHLRLTYLLPKHRSEDEASGIAWMQDNLHLAARPSLIRPSLCLNANVCDSARDNLRFALGKRGSFLALTAPSGAASPAQPSPALPPHRTWRSPILHRGQKLFFFLFIPEGSRNVVCCPVVPVSWRLARSNQLTCDTCSRQARLIGVQPPCLHARPVGGDSTQVSACYHPPRP